MLVVSEQAFGVAGYHRLSAPQDAVQDLAQGPIVAIEIEFEQWLGGQPLAAEAFIDLGADNTWISSRWIREQAQAASASIDAPKIAPDGVLIEQAHLSIGDLRLPLGDLQRPVVVTEQGPGADPLAQMPGFEDLLLGRDFITQHGLLLVIDGARRTFSILAPVDAANRERRDRVLTTLAAPDLV
jgi:hypothetical protein